MNIRYLPILLCVAIALLSPAARAAEAPNSQKLIADIEREYETLKESIAAKKAAVEAAISRASKAGTLKASTETYFRETLEGFRETSSGLPDFQRAYYPPRFDSSEEMEPINKAWTDLKQEMSRAQELASRASVRLVEAACFALETAGRTAEKAEDLAGVETLIAAAAKFPDVSRTRIPSSTGTNTEDMLGKIAGAMKAALDAQNRQDVRAMITALARISTTGANSSFFRMTPLPIRVETVWDEFRQRMAKAFANTAREAQAAVEKAIVADQPTTQIDLLLEEYLMRATNVEKLKTDPERMPYSQQGDDKSPAVVKNYRAVLAAMAELKSDDDELANASMNYQQPAQLQSTGNFAATPEFTRFVIDLSAKRSRHRTELKAAREKKQRDEQAASQKKQMDEERQRSVNEIAEASERAKKAMEILKEKFAALTTPESAAALADEMPRMFGMARSRSGEEGTDWRSVQVELRQIATWWADPTGQIQRSVEYQRSMDPQIAIELRKLRERVEREVWAARLDAPELRKSPLLELPVATALGKLAAEAGEKGDWKRADALLRGVTVNGVGYDQTPRGGGGNELVERKQAIRSYLVGLNYEQADQFREAVMSYQQVLQFIGQSAPIKEAAARIKAIKAEHPDVLKSIEQAPKRNLPVE